jgi:hypothetical protein
MPDPNVDAWDRYCGEQDLAEQAVAAERLEGMVRAIAPLIAAPHIAALAQEKDRRRMEETASLTVRFAQQAVTAERLEKDRRRMEETASLTVRFAAALIKEIDREAFA